MMRLSLVAASLLSSSLALGATVSLNQPAEGETMRGGTVTVIVSTSSDFKPGHDGWIELWVDGARAATLRGKSGQVVLQPGNHQLQARLVNLNHQPLRITANSDQITVTVPTQDPAGN